MTGENKREYVSWKLKVMCEVNGLEDTAAVQEIIQDAMTRLVVALKRRQPGVMCNGPSHEMYLEDETEGEVTHGE